MNGNRRKAAERACDRHRHAGHVSRRGISHGENEEEVAEKAERHSRRKRLRKVLTAVLIAALLAVGFMYYKDNHAYTDYTVAWEKEIAASESSTTEFVPFGENVLKYTKDGASYLDKSGKAVWSMSYELKSPICYVNGDYAVIGTSRAMIFILWTRPEARDRRRRFCRSCASAYRHTASWRRWWRTAMLRM